MVDTRSTANSDSNQRETTILENLHQCSSAPTESLSEENHSEHSEHSRLKIEVNKCIDNFKKYVKGKSQINTQEDFSLSVGVTKRPNYPPDSSNFQFTNPVQPRLDISNQEQ